MAFETRSLNVKIPAIISLVLPPIFVTTRLWIRLALTRSFGVDDWMILASMISSIVMSVVLLVAIHYGYGMHMKDIPKEDIAMALRYYWYIQTFYKITLNLTKISILLLYLRIFTQKWFQICCYILISLVATYGLVSLFYSSVFQCHPIRKAYYKSLPGHCIDVVKTWQANAGFSIASDIFILILPMPVIGSLHMSRRHKLGLALLFGLGSFVLVVSCLRATFLNASINPDVTYRTAVIIEWTIIEPNLGIICACIPVIHRPFATLVVKIWPHKLRKTSLSAHYVHQRSTTHGNDTVRVNENPWYPLEPYDAANPTRITSVLSKPQAHRDDDESVHNSTFITKTTDISVHYGV